MSIVEQGARYQKRKEYPNIPSDLITSAATVIGGLVALHAGADIATHFSLPFFEPVMQVANNFGEWLAHTSSSLAEVIPHVKDGTTLTAEVAKTLPVAGRYLTKDVIGATVAAGIATGVRDIVKSGSTFFKKPEMSLVPGDASNKAADNIIRTLGKTVDHLKVATDVEEISHELKNPKVPKTSFLAWPLSLPLWLIPPRFLADIVLDRETYDYLPGNAYNRIHRAFFANVATRLLGRFPGPGEVTDTYNELIRTFAPKRDALHQRRNDKEGWHHDGGSGLLAGVRIIAGLLPFITGEDVDGALTLRVRHSGILNSPEYADKIQKRAELIAASKVQRRARDYK